MQEIAAQASLAGSKVSAFHLDGKSATALKHDVSAKVGK